MQLMTPHKKRLILNIEISHSHRSSSVEACVVASFQQSGNRKLAERVNFDHTKVGFRRDQLYRPACVLGSISPRVDWNSQLNFIRGKSQACALHCSPCSKLLNGCIAYSCALKPFTVAMTVLKRST